MKLTMKRFTRNLNLFDEIPVQPYRELFEDRQEKYFTMSQALNPSNVDVGTGNFAYFIRFSKKINQFTNLIPTKNSNYNTRNTDKITIFHTKHDFSKILFFHPLLLNGISQIFIFQLPLVLVFSKEFIKVHQTISKQCF